jgi:hypothetical protein
LGILNRVESGLIYYNDFDSSNLDYNLKLSSTESGRFEVGGGYLTLFHGVMPFKVFLKVLEDKYVVVMKNDYNPTVVGDVGGLVVFQDEKTDIEIEEYYNEEEGVTKTYPFLKIEKDGINYYAYWSDDGITWYLLGSTAVIFSGENVGVFLKGVSGEDLKVDFIKIYKSNFIKLINLFKGTKIELYDSNGNLCVSSIVDDSIFYIQAPYYPFDGYFKFYSIDGQVYEQSETLTMWGGDIYIKESNLDIEYNNSIIKSGEELNLGTLNNTITLSFNLINNTSSVFTNVIVSVVQYGNNDAYKLADVSLDDVQYYDSVVIPEIRPTESYTVYVKLVKQEVVIIQDGIGEFEILISHD